ncbi:cation:proton antiporter [Microbispora sp. ZYX-F-249]|uniref:Cation:proton antiporter n=1 Tax=Microbispora maris TaxID=3144104 RepID=A0ABV0AXD2_9ACTN
MDASPVPVAPIGAHQLLLLLLQIGVLLGTALALGRAARRVGLPPVIGELGAGVLLGPSLLGQVAPGLSGWLLPHDPAQTHMLDAVGQIGVLLLVGVTGMSMDLALMRRTGATSLLVSGGGLLVPLACGVLLGFGLPAALLAPGGDRQVFAWFLGVAMCVSAIPVIAKVLLELRLLHRRVGQLIVNASALDDVVGWLLLSVVSAMATTGLRAGSVVSSVLYLALVVAIAAFVGRPVVAALLRLSARSPESGVTVAVAVLVVFLCAAGTQALGMEAVFGGFLGGILLGAASGRQLRMRLASLRTVVMSVFAPLFFATAGLRVDLTALARPVVVAAALAVLAVAVAGKFAGAYLGARAGRLGHWEGIALGAGLNARGVIEVVIAMAGLRLGVLSGEMYTIVVLVAIVTSLVAPPMLRFAVRRMQGPTTEERERERELALEPLP